MRRWLRTRRGLRYRYRLMAAMLVVSLPLMVVLAVLLTTKASASLSSAGRHKGVQVARAVTLRLEDWLSERRESLTTLAAEAAGQLGSPATARSLARADKLYGDYSLLEIADVRGEVLASSRSGVRINQSGEDWFTTAVAGKFVMTSPVSVGDHIQWIAAAPVPAADGHPAGVVIGDLDPVLLTELLNPELEAGNEVLAVDRHHQLVYDSETMSNATEDAAMVAAGGLSDLAANLETTATATKDRN